MSGERLFFDANILVYWFDPKAPDKQAASRELWYRACREATPVISTQVLQEFFVTVTKQAKQGMAIPAAREAMLVFADAAHVVAASVPLITAATRRAESSGFSFWDSLIIESAIDSAACRLWTEDLQDGQVFGRLRVSNPFVSLVR